MSYILSLDQGTTSSRAIIFDSEGRQVCCSQECYTQYFPQSGWVEHNPEEIWSSQQKVALDALSKINPLQCVAIGITNQRETTIVWDAATGKPIYNAIVWQDRRTSNCCEQLLPYEKTIREKTGLLPDPYFSASKLQWILANVPGARERAERGELRFGTVDCWLIWKLTGGKVHATDVSNASRTQLFNIHTLQWDEELLGLFDIPRSILPEVVDSSAIVGTASLGGYEIPIGGVLGDQQAALFGQMCIGQGATKCTYGTGCFLLMNTGTDAVESKNRLLTTVAWRIGSQTHYALEGSVFVGGSAVQFIRDGLGLIKSSSEIEELALSVPDNGGVYFVPALTGLGAPYWDSQARGLICGLSRGTTAAHIARATLEGIAFQVMDIVSSMEKDAGVRLREFKVDGGASRNGLLMQMQADLTGATVIRPVETETTALGAAYAAGLATGVWKSVNELSLLWKADRTFNPVMSQDSVEALKTGWAEAVKKTLA